MRIVQRRSLSAYQVSISPDLTTNNLKIFKILEFEIKLFEKPIWNCFAKIKEFIEDFTLNEGSQYLMQVFSETVSL
jgi:hypothetical protein